MITLTDVSKDELSRMQAELEEELRQAELDFANGDFIELTVEQPLTRPSVETILSGRRRGQGRGHQTGRSVSA